MRHRNWRTVAAEAWRWAVSTRCHLCALAVLTLLIVLFGSIPTEGRAQTTCPPVDRVEFPVDPAAFRVMQDFGVRNVRRDGRYHTGEDWHIDRALGQPVRAIANGRVTYAWDQGWGRDGGVIILEHQMPNDTTLYSVYGHLMPAQGATFPAGFDCVSAGDVLGVIGPALPVPHLHFEVRNANPGSPGFGYTWEEPSSVGYRHPTQFILNWQARFLPQVAWVATVSDPTGPIAPPLVLSDLSMLYLDDDRLARLTWDGRSLWRRPLDRPVIGVTGWRGESLLHYADGTVQRINLDGTLGDSWATDALAIGSPFAMGDLLVFPSAAGGLIALDAERREIAWRVDDPSIIAQAATGAQAMALLTTERELLTLSRTGTLLDRAQMRQRPALTVYNDGTLLVYGQGGLWRVLNDGAWQLFSAGVPPGGEHSAIATLADGGLVLFDGETVYAFDGSGNPRWQTTIGLTDGEAMLAPVGGGHLVLLTSDGRVSVLGVLGGAVCAQVNIYSVPGARTWHALGDDNTLRVFIGNTVLGLDWPLITANCV